MIKDPVSAPFGDVTIALWKVKEVRPFCGISNFAFKSGLDGL